MPEAPGRQWQQGLVGTVIKTVTSMAHWTELRWQGDPVTGPSLTAANRTVSNWRRVVVRAATAGTGEAQAYAARWVAHSLLPAGSRRYAR